MEGGKGVTGNQGGLASTYGKIASTGPVNQFCTTSIALETDDPRKPQTYSIPLPWKRAPKPLLQRTIFWRKARARHQREYNRS